MAGVTQAQSTALLVGASRLCFTTTRMNREPPSPSAVSILSSSVDRKNDFVVVEEKEGGDNNTEEEGEGWDGKDCSPQVNKTRCM